MFIFSLLFIFIFLYAINGVLKKKEELVLSFFIFALPIYITALSTTMLYGFDKLVPFMQYAKELIIIITLIVLIVRIEAPIKFHIFDKLVISYLLIVFIYVILPLGGLSLYQKLVAAKSITVFFLVYFIGRIIPYKKINLNKYINYIIIVAIAAGSVVTIEYFFDSHLQNHTGYTDFMFQFFNQASGGDYGLSWTFQTQNGLKRFASFFSMPLEHAASTLLSLAVIGALITKNNNKIVLNKLVIAAILATTVSVLFAVSRASIVSYFLMIYLYAIITMRRQFLKIIHFSVGIIIICFLFYIQGDVYDFVLNTINFTDSSSLSHLLAWGQSMESIILNPIGIGLGASGNTANSFGGSVGGENEFLIIGVQVGIIAMFIYLFLYGYAIFLSWVSFKNEQGKLKKLALLIFLLKFGLLLPSLTSEAESYLYISYLTWFFTGYLINLISSSANYRLPQIELKNISNTN